MTEFYVEKRSVKPSKPGSTPLRPAQSHGATGREAAISFLEPFFAGHPDIRYTIARIIADGNLVAVHSHGVFGPEDRGIAVVDILRCRRLQGDGTLGRGPTRSGEGRQLEWDVLTVSFVGM